MVYVSVLLDQRGHMSKFPYWQSPKMSDFFIRTDFEVYNVSCCALIQLVQELLSTVLPVDSLTNIARHETRKFNLP